MQLTLIITFVFRNIIMQNANHNVKYRYHTYVHIESIDPSDLIIHLQFI